MLSERVCSVDIVATLVEARTRLRAPVSPRGSGRTLGMASGTIGGDGSAGGGGGEGEGEQNGEGSGEHERGRDQEREGEEEATSGGLRTAMPMGVGDGVGGGGSVSDNFKAGVVSFVAGVRVVESPSPETT